MTKLKLYHTLSNKFDLKVSVPANFDVLRRRFEMQADSKIFVVTGGNGFIVRFPLAQRHL